MKKEDGRVRITRQMIRTALLNLLREKPLQHITVRELCEKASINRGTFYAHYDDIYDLMEQIEQSMFDEFKAILRPLLEDQDPYDLVETITRIFSYIREHADLCLVTLGPHSDKKLLYRLIELGIRGFWNFTNVELSSSVPDVFFENVHFVDTLLTLSYRISRP